MARIVGRIVRGVVALALVAGVAAGAYHTRDRWLPFFRPAEHAEDHGPATTAAPSEKVLLSAQAQKNLRLVSKPLVPTTFWKTISVPGVIVDRPGHSDRGVVAPLTGVVTRIHHFPGETVNPGDDLFTVRLLSDILHQTQSDLFKATQDIGLAEEQKKLLLKAGGAVAETKIVEVDNQIARLRTAVKAYRQELLNRGLLPEQIDGAAKGTFVTEIVVRVPPRASDAKSTGPAFEMQELKVELGQQVEAGQTLCLLANHQLLAIEGRAFREETPLLERAVRENWSIDVDFQEDPSSIEGDKPDEKKDRWKRFDQPLVIRYLSNTIDPATRTFTFLIPFENEWRVIEQDKRPIILWRFRPGHQVRLQLRVEKLDNVFILPPEAVVREGGEAYVFRQNGDTFDRKPVHVVYQDRRHVVIANDGSVPPGLYVAQNAAVQLNRMAKSQSSTLPKGFHVHADGTVHMGSH
jgi:biotin carboxyl carrier protein